MRVEGWSEKSCLLESVQTPSDPGSGTIEVSARRMESTCKYYPIGLRLLGLGLVDQIYLAPIRLGDGTRLCDNSGSQPICLHRVGEENPALVPRARYRTTGMKIPTNVVSGT